MRRLVVFCLALASMFIGPATAISAPAATSAVRSPSREATNVVMQTPEQALAQDLGLIAEARGWTAAEAAAYYRAEQAIGRVAVNVAAERPEAFVGSALSLKPDGAPTLYVKGPADKLINDLVDAAGVEIVVADNQPFSLEELEARKLRVHHALEAQGFDLVVTGVDITRGGLIESSVTRKPGLDAEVDDIVSRLPADLRSSVALTVRDVPVVEDEGAFGGMWVLDNGANECTSG